MANNIIIREKKSEKQKIKNTRKMCVGDRRKKSVFKVRYTFYVQVSLIIYKKGFCVNSRQFGGFSPHLNRHLVGPLSMVVVQVSRALFLFLFLSS